MKHNQQLKYSTILIVIFIITALLLTACGGAKPKTYTIGVAYEVPALTEVIDPFKAAMTELGYVEGKNVTYIYHDALGTDPQKNEAEIKSLMGQKADLLLTLGTAPSLAAKKAVEGTGTPVVFAPVVNPIEEGLITSISHPGGNLTGIQLTNDAAPKSLEWLLKLAPGTKRVYIPYHPADPIALMSIKSLPDAAAKLGVELVLDEVLSGDEELAAIKALPQDSAIFIVLSPSLIPTWESVLDMAAELRIPVGTSTSDIGDKLLFTYVLDTPMLAKQAAGLVDKILKGNKPGDLPVETAEMALQINLKTAQALGLDIPDEFIHQAQQIVR